MTRSSSLVFRQEVTPNDRLVVRRIVESTGFFSTPEIEVAVELVDQRLAHGDASGYFFLFAQSMEQTMGYVCYGPVACTVGTYDLYWIAVDRKHQRQGLGRRLLDEAERKIEQQAARQVYIETSNRPQYTPTRNFYLRCGYEVAAVLKDFYDRGDDKVVLRKELEARQRAAS